MQVLQSSAQLALGGAGAAGAEGAEGSGAANRLPAQAQAQASWSFSADALRASLPSSRVDLYVSHALPSSLSFIRLLVPSAITAITTSFIC